MILADFISPDVRAARSVNLERDKGNQATLRHYHLTGKGLEILSRLASALNGERVSAWSLTGPYGMGKSSFANFLMALCGPASEEETRIARQMLEEKDSSLGMNLFQLLSKHSSREKGLFRVGVTASFESINRTLARGLRRALLKNNSSGPIRGFDLPWRSVALIVPLL
jgi:ABC-type molybdenum transport system ATPase subunit/photorepair protein PhrA